MHGIRGGAHSGQNDVACGANLRRVRRNLRVDLEALQGELQRSGIGAAACDDHGPQRAHKVPLVLGSSEPSSRTAWRRLRPTPLKQDSIM